MAVLAGSLSCVTVRSIKSWEACLIRSVIAMLALACIATPALAEDCGPLKMITSLDATPLHDSSVLTVDARFNGTAKPMIVQTGTLISSLRQGAVDALG